MSQTKTDLNADLEWIWAKIDEADTAIPESDDWQIEKASVAIMQASQKLRAILNDWNTRPAVKLPEKPSELVGLAMDDEQYRRADFIVEVYTRKFLNAARSLNLKQGIGNKMDCAYFEPLPETHKDGLRAVQAALEKEGL